jgi:hypothetical protein
MLTWGNKMNKRIFFIIWFIMILSSVAYNQTEFTFFASASYNSFSLEELKQQQEELLNSMNTRNLPYKITQAFPSYYGFKAGFLISLENNEMRTISLGAAVQHQSTGGRIQYQDYSGEDRMDEVLAGTGIGALFNYELHFTSRFDCGFNLAAYYLFSNIALSYHFQVDNIARDQLYKFNSSSLAFEPEIVPSINIWKINIGISFSYLFYLPSTFAFEEDKNSYLRNNMGDKVKLDWSGFRMGLQSSISF